MIGLTEFYCLFLANCTLIWRRRKSPWTMGYKIILAVCSYTSHLRQHNYHPEQCKSKLSQKDTWTLSLQGNSVANPIRVNLSHRSNNIMWALYSSVTSYALHAQWCTATVCCKYAWHVYRHKQHTNSSEPHIKRPGDKPKSPALQRSPLYSLTRRVLLCAGKNHKTQFKLCYYPTNAI